MGGEDLSDERRMEAEQRYVTSEITLAALSDEMGIPLNTLKRWCKSDNWVKKREKAQKRAVRKAVTRATEKKARALARLLEATDEIEKALLHSSRALAEAAGTDPMQFVLRNTKKMLDVAEGIERTAHTRAMTGGAMTAAEREKLELLRREQERKERETDARQAGEGPQEIKITYQGVEDMEAYHE